MAGFVASFSKRGQKKRNKGKSRARNSETTEMRRKKHGIAGFVACFSKRESIKGKREGKGTTEMNRKKHGQWFCVMAGF